MFRKWFTPLLTSLQAGDSERVKERVEDTLRSILGRTANGTEPDNEFLYELSESIAAAVSKEAERSEGEGGSVVTLRLEGGDDASEITLGFEGGDVNSITGPEILPDGETSEIQGLS